MKQTIELALEEFHLDRETVKTNFKQIDKRIIFACIFLHAVLTERS